ncbi:hypothetical protein EJB05_37179, partial [Eragrostis curvula]
MPPLSVMSNLAQCATSYRFCFRCCLVEFLSGSTSQGFDVRLLIVECAETLQEGRSIPAALDDPREGEATATGGEAKRCSRGRGDDDSRGRGVGAHEEGWRARVREGKPTATLDARDDPRGGGGGVRGEGRQQHPQ